MGLDILSGRCHCIAGLQQYQESSILTPILFSRKKKKEKKDITCFPKFRSLGIPTSIYPLNGGAEGNLERVYRHM